MAPFSSFKHMAGPTLKNVVTLIFVIQLTYYLNTNTYIVLRFWLKKLTV